MKIPSFTHGAVLALALLLSACGGGGDDDDAPATASAGSSADTPATTASDGTSRATALPIGLTTSGTKACATTARSNVAYECTVRSSLSGTVSWTLSGAPAGMAIQPASGALHWTPLLNQLGTHTVHVIAFNGSQTQGNMLTLTVVAMGQTNPAGR